MNYERNGIPIEIEYRNVKNINLYIKSPDGHVLITAPKEVTKSKIFEFVDSKMVWIQKHRFQIQKRQFESTDELKVNQEQLENMRDNIKKYAKKWEEIMYVQKACFLIRDMKTRWGSCSIKTGRIRLNKRLALYPEEYLEYVIVHELCHLIEPSHNMRFKNYMTGFMPDWKERKKRLNEIIISSHNRHL